MSREHGKPKIPSSKMIQKRQSKEPLGHPTQLHLSHLKNLSVEELRETAKQLRKKLTEKQLQVMNTQKSYRMELFKNQNAKQKVLESDKDCQRKRMKIAEKLLSQYKNNKDSPLFYNENGLSPFQLMLLQYNRYQANEQHICMICYIDIQPNIHTSKLPCQHLFHRECAMQHLLYCRACPACGKQIAFEFEKEGKMMKKQ